MPPYTLDLIGRHDALILDFFAANYGGQIPGKTPQVLWASPKKRFMEYVTRRDLNNDRVALPRIAVQRLGTTPRPDNHIFSTIPYVRQENGKWVESHPPAPVEYSYQVDLWTERQWEMNYWERRTHLLFWSRGMLQYLKVSVGDPWFDKWARLTLDGIDDNTDIEPGTEEDRQVRKTLSLKLATWTFPEMDSDPFGLFDSEFFHRYKMIKTVGVSIYDYDGTELFESIVIR